MMNLKTLSSGMIFTAALVLAGCSGLHQDPLANESDAIKNGLEKPTKPDTPQATDSNAVHIEAPDFYSFREATEGYFVVTSRILETGYTAYLTLENMSDFPGATYDAKTGRFTWTPAKGSLVDDKDMVAEKVLKVRVVGKNPTSVDLVGTRSIPVRVYKTLGVPEIFSVQKSSNSMREGEFMNVTVSVRDKDAGTDPTSWPRLQVLSTKGKGSIASYVELQNTMALGNGEFSITLKIDLTNAEVTRSREDMGFTLKASSRFSLSSASYDVSLFVNTSLSDTQSTWFAPLEVILGQKGEYQFMIFDPTSQGEVTVESWTGLPTSAVVNCTASMLNRSAQMCKLAWNPDFTSTTGDFNVTANVLIKNLDSNDTYVKRQAIPVVLRVSSAPPVIAVAPQEGGN